jgi:hypothetical protein
VAEDVTGAVRVADDGQFAIELPPYGYRWLRSMVPSDRTRTGDGPPACDEGDPHARSSGARAMARARAWFACGSAGESTMEPRASSGRYASTKLDL